MAPELSAALGQFGANFMIDASDGIGRKTAERLVMELRDKVDLAPAPAGAAARPASLPVDPVQEAVSALIALGYKPNEASRAVTAAAPTVLTFLYWPASTALVELRTSQVATCQSPGSAVYFAGSATSLNPGSRGRLP